MTELVESFVRLLTFAHDNLREAVAGLEEAALAWTPAPETNSISTLIVHVLGSEAEVLRVVRGLPSARDRAAEFTETVHDPAELVRRIDEADRLLEELASGITRDDLSTERARPAAVRQTPRPGIYWLLNSLAHAREHVGHIELTKQLLAANSR